jgi:hypothetical protein
MRKFSFAVVGVVALIALTSGLALGKKPPRARPALVRCGMLYTKPCTAPALTITSLSPACKAAGATISLSPIRVRDNGGIRSVKVTFGGKAIKLVKYRGAPTKKTIRGVKVKTSGLRSGIVYTITLKLVDTRGMSKTKTLHFAICKPKPVFTG